MIRHYFAGRRLHKAIAAADLERNERPLSEETITYVEDSVLKVHEALLRGHEPSYSRPDYPFDGWGITQTSYSELLTMPGGITSQSYIGDRAFYFATDHPGSLLRVLSVPRPEIAFDSRIVRIGRSSVRAAMQELPSLYSGFMSSIEETILEYNLNVDIQPPSLPEI